MSVYELCELGSASAFVLALLCAAETVRYAVSKHVVEVWRDVSGRKRQSDLDAQDRRFGQKSNTRRVPDAAPYDLAAQMQALTEIASIPSQDEIETRVADGEKGKE